MPDPNRPPDQMFSMMQTPTMKRIRKEAADTQRKADVDYLRALANGLREESEMAVVTEQMEEDAGLAVRTAARALDVAADNIEKDGRRG